MERFLRSKPVLALIAFILLTGAIAVPLSGSLNPLHASSSVSSVSPWPQQGFNETNNAFNAADNTFNTQNVATITSLWSNSIPNAFNSDAPVVDNGRIYVEQGADLYGLNERTGAIEWHVSMQSPSDAVPPQLVNGKLYVVTQDGNIRAFDASDDTQPQLWSAPSGNGFTISNGVIYTSNGSSNITAYNANTGSLIWSQPAPCAAIYGMGYGRPAIDSQLGAGFMGCWHSGTIFAFHLSDGSQEWSQSNVKFYGTSVVIANGLVYVAGVVGSQGSSNLVVLNEQTGSVVWSQKVGNNTIDTLPVIVNGVVYVEYSVLNGVNGTEGVAGLDATTGTAVWTQYPTGSPHYTENERLAVANGVVYAGANALEAFDAATGTQLLDLFPPHTDFISDPVIADGMIFEWARDINTLVYTLYGFSLPGTTPTPTPTLSPSPSPSPTPPPNRQVLFIILQGINSQLTKQEIAHNPVGTALGSVGSTLENKFPKAKFVEFSYGGSLRNGTPKPYLCDPTFINPILTDIQLLNAQIANAVGRNHNTDIYLVGHSLGGVIAFGYLALLEDHLNGVSLPSGAQLKAVVTLDSPLGGVYGNQYAYFSKYIATNYLTPNKQVISNYPCKGLVGKKTPLTTIDDLVRVYNSQNNGGTTPPDDPGNDPLGATASIEAILGVTQPPPPLPFLPSNEIIAQSAHTDLGTSVLSIGNMADYLWNPAPCAPFVVPLSPALAAAIAVIPNFNSTQFQEDQGSGSSFYGRSINTASICDAATLGNALNHNDVLVNSAALNGLVNFLSPVGSTPIPLAVEPYQP